MSFVQDAGGVRTELPVHYDVRHVTRYKYEDGVSMSQHLLHLQPLSSPWQQCHDHRIEVTPAADETWTGVDFFGNRTQVVNVNHAHDEFCVDSRSQVTVLPRPRLLGLADSPPWEEVSQMLQALRHVDGDDPRQFLFESPHVDLLGELARYALPSFAAGRPLIESCHDLMRRIRQGFVFDPRATDVSTPVHEVLRLKRGVCQDFAHLMIGCLRSLGIAARYVSGYIQTHRLDSDREMTGADASHAWVSAWCPLHGWVDFDPTNDLLVDREHITVAIGRDFGDISPVRGVVLGRTGDPEVAVTVKNRGQSPFR